MAVCRGKSVGPDEGLLWVLFIVFPQRCVRIEGVLIPCTAPWSLRSAPLVSDTGTFLRVSYEVLSSLSPIPPTAGQLQTPSPRMSLGAPQAWDVGRKVSRQILSGG